MRRLFTTLSAVALGISLSSACDEEPFAYQRAFRIDCPSPADGLSVMEGLSPAPGQEGASTLWVRCAKDLSDPIAIDEVEVAPAMPDGNLYIVVEGQATTRPYSETDNDGITIRGGTGPIVTRLVPAIAPGEE